MKKRGRAGVKAAKARPGKTLKPKGRSASKTKPRPSAAPARETEIARLTRERDEALEQQSATSEVLQVISSSPSDLQPVFATMLEKAVRICEAKFGTMYLCEDRKLRLIAAHNVPPAFEKVRGDEPFTPAPDGIFDKVMKTGKAVHLVDLAATKPYAEHHPRVVEAVELGGIRTVVAVPMLKEDHLVGIININRREVRPFTDDRIALVTNFAAQAVIAIENARLLSELRASLQQQTATSEVLQVISNSPGDLQPVFDTMLAKAALICDASFGNVFRTERDALQLVGTYNTPPAFAEVRRRSLVRPDPDGPFGQMLAKKVVAHIADLAAEEVYKERRHPGAAAAVELGGVRTVLLVPMLKGDELVGVFSLYRQEVRPFNEKQVELVKNFAAQAVIAIENARLLSELRESLQQQTATADVLKVISRSAFDLKVVLDALLQSAGRLCEADMGVIARRQDDRFYRTVSYGLPDDLNELIDDQAVELSRSSGSGRALLEGKVIQITDIEADPEYTHPSRGTGAFRTLVGVPMIREGVPVGVMTLARKSVRPFTDKQIELVTTFADQAAIAIENVRLFEAEQQHTRELSESLEQQTATSEVLQVISSSPGDLQPVFEAMLEKAVRVCDANFGNAYRWDGQTSSLVASHNTPAAYAEFRKRSPIFKDGSPTGRMLATKTVVHIEDVAASQLYLNRNPPQVAAVELGGMRTFLAVPMLKEGELIGALALSRQEVRPFTDKQIALVQNFAAQAVIAIENARLLNELRDRTTDLAESLEQQTATSEVLKVISSSPGELEGVFQALLENATRICEASFGTLMLYEGDTFRRVALHNAEADYLEFADKAPLLSVSSFPTLQRIILTPATYQIADMSESEPDSPVVKFGHARTLVAVPMLKENELVGVIGIFRREVRPFTDKHIKLLDNFAAQAVIAVENARLLNELRQRTQEVEKLNQHLEQRVTDQVGEIERMGRLRRFLPPQVADLIVASGTEKQLESHRREITALFCDLRGFTGFTEVADAEDVMALLREYHAAVGEIVVKYNGTLERYAGDGIMIIFNDPIPVSNPALLAVQMALEMRKAIDALTEKWRQLGHEIGFGIGIAHGYATLGTIGFEGRFDYAAIGTVSNVASRLCDEAKPGQILISPRVLMAVKDAVTVESVGEFELKGIRRPIAAHNVLAVSVPTH